MRSPRGWLIVVLVQSLIALSVSIFSAYPRYMKTPLDAVLWGLWDSAIFLVAAAISSVYVLIRRQLGTPMLVFLVLLLVVGAAWLFVYLVALGLYATPAGAPVRCAMACDSPLLRRKRCPAR